MINLITGLPGAGKTLRSIVEIKALAEASGRPVFYHGVEDLTLPWQLIDADKWFDCPHGSIIYISEAQRIFRPTAIGAAVPLHVSALETHRHKGHDLFLDTQHPMLLHNAVRRLVGRHVHIVRAYGSQFATLHEWQSCRETCDKPSGREDSDKKRWPYDKEAFGFYKSAEVHTHKVRIPRRLMMLALLPVVLGALIFFLYKSVMARMAPVEQGAPGSTVSRQSQGTIAGTAAPPISQLADAKQFVFDRTPRVVGLPHTAPRYDRATEPVTAPIPAACVSSLTRCQCFSQQGTTMDLPNDLCRDIVAKGFFIDFDSRSGPDRDRDRDYRRNERPTARSNDPADSPLAPLRENSDKGRSAASGYGYGLAGRREGPRIPDPARLAEVKS